MNSRAVLFGVALAVGLPSAALALPTCAQLGSDPANGLAGNPQIVGLTAALTPVGPGVTVPYCQINFTLSSECGPTAGYRTGQCEQIKLRIGLPASIADGGTGGVQGAWNGKNRDLGGGGYVGSVGGVTSSTNRGYVGTSTDTGHSGSIVDGSFALNPDGTLNMGLIRDFARDGIHDQHIWGLKLAKTYYGTDPSRKYWLGCSTGGRQGHYQAQNFPKDFDGIVAGAPATSWDRLLTAGMWPPVMMQQELGGPIAVNKLNAVTSAAIAACDGNDGIVDGILEDPRTCTYNATAFICVANGGTSTDPNCLTPAEAAVVNKIWDGPIDASGNRAWFGPDRGASLLTVAGPLPTQFTVDHFRYWIKQNPSFDWHTGVTETSFFSDMLTSIQKFNDVIGTDDDLVQFRAKGGKIITYHGLADPLIPSLGTYHYYNSIPGGIQETQKYYRFFRYPNASHCVGAGLDAEVLFSALVNWVENGVAPDHVVAQVSPTRTRKICKYPDTQVYNGSGSIDDEANFTCQSNKKDDLADTFTIDKPYKTSIKANTN